MAGEELRGEYRKEVLGDLFGLMLHRAVAESAVLLAQSLPEGTEEQIHWTDVASRAVPMAADFLGSVKDKDYTGEEKKEATGEVALTVDERQIKLGRLAALEAEIAELRAELGD